MTREHDTEVLLCCLLWSRAGQEAALTAYEDRGLTLVPEHGGAVVQRAIGDGAAGQPNEVQIYRFATRAAFETFLADPRRLAMTGERERVIARTEVFPVALV